jgi:DNA-binding Lrp family transcriptional regulator
MLDKTDRIILRHLQHDAKITIKELADKLKLTNSPVYERIKDMEENGIIKGYTTLVDHKKVGKGQVVFCNVTIPDYSPETICAFEKEIQDMPEVLACYHFAGEIDYQLKVLVEDIDAYYAFLQEFTKLGMVKVHSSVVVLKEVKNTTEIPV